jgi:hypothetical protein
LASYGQEHKSASTCLHHVKQGKMASLTDLLALVRYSMPGYQVLQHLLPGEAPTAPTALLLRYGHVRARLLLSMNTNSSCKY